eukprot:10114477-Lingulodinium_polyedra.AAC.1
MPPRSYWMRVCACIHPTNAMTVLSCAVPKASWSACAAACRKVPICSSCAVVCPPAACWRTQAWS